MPWSEGEVFLSVKAKKGWLSRVTTGDLGLNMPKKLSVTGWLKQNSYIMIPSNPAKSSWLKPPMI